MTTNGNETSDDLGVSPESLYNPGHPDNGEAPRPSGEDSASSLIQFDAGQDLSKASKRTLGDYLSRLTAGSVGTSRPNKFKIPGGSRAPADGFIVDPNISSNQSGPASKSQNESAGNTLGTFIDLASGYNSTVKERFESTKDSQYAGGDNPFVGSEIKNFGAVSRAQAGLDGHTAAASIVEHGAQSNDPGGAPPTTPTPRGAPEHQMKISEVLLNNRFTALGPFVKDHQTESAGFTAQRQMGKYDSTDSSPTVTIDQLKNVAAELMLRSAGYKDIDPDDPDSVLEAQLPSITDTGFPVISSDDLRPQNTVRGQEITKNRTTLINDEDETLSYGNSNTYLDQFGATVQLNSNLIVATGIAAIFVQALTVAGLIKGVTALGGLVSGDQSPADPGNPSTLRKGKKASRLSDSTVDIYRVLDIPTLDHDFIDCVIVGIQVFFGIKTSGFVSTLVAGGIPGINALNVTQSPGYYVNILRAVIRDTQQVANSFGNLGTSVDVLAPIKAISSSTTYRFLIVLAQIGNQKKNSDGAAYASIDSTGENSENRVKKSRRGTIQNNYVGVGSNGSESALVWRHATAPSRYLLPQSFTLASSVASALKGGVGSAAVDAGVLAYKETENSASGDGEGTRSNLGDHTRSATITSAKKGRLPAEYVEFIENELESEYVPFYFQDLRTNEIISFHAFLSGLSDGFSASYNQVSGYGRAEDVMIYDKTTRKISFSFHVVATSPQDLDVMYFSINKLVSMLYPQYSRGRVMTVGEGDDIKRFVQPFSQLQTASPMIRVRIGDVIKSNYSKFGLARLFGLGQDESAFKLGPTAQASDEIARAQTNFAEAIEKRGLLPRDDGTTGYQPGDKVIARLTDPNVINQLGANEPPADIDFVNALNIVKQLLRASQGQAKYEVEILPRVVAGGELDLAAIAEAAEAAISYKYRATFQFSGHPQLGNQTFTYEGTNLPHSDIDGLTEEFKAQLAAQFGFGPEEPVATRVSSFFSAENNPIVRSFESTRGRGLAGFITEMNFDWAESTWETSPGQRAPKMINVSVSFTPIHDIPMGLDSDGMMRSLPYNVGGISRGVGADPYDID